tara:strand:+ start:8071 stop:8652 length:582 start_codon:yes stop_codon:yes gene_type:complete
MFPSLLQISSGLNFAFLLLRGKEFDLIKSKIIVSPLGLWHVIFFATIISILAKLTILKIAFINPLPSRLIIATIPLMIIELCLFTMFVFYLTKLLNKENYFFNFIISFLWLVSLQSLLVFLISLLLWFFPSVALLVGIIGAVISIQILVVQFKLGRQLLNVGAMIAGCIVLGNVIVGILVGVLDQVAYSLVSG